jgi:formylglycine-generating enzyme required for sulfatase activity
MRRALRRAPLALASPILITLLAGPAASEPGDHVAIPAGSCFRGAPAGAADAEAAERPGRTIALSAFAIDRTEVTRGAYAACVLAGRCPPRRDLGLRDLVSRLPMTEVSHVEATAYCRAAGARLPPEAEWERAARGARDARRYPWGDEPDCARANFGNFEGEGRCPRAPGRPVEVGAFPAGASPEGVLDLAGNVWEWTADYYDPDAYAKAPASDPRGPRAPVPRRPEELGRAPRRSVRGGACCSMLGLPRVDNRVGFPEDYRDIDLGFRCAR